MPRYECFPSDKEGLNGGLGIRRRSSKYKTTCTRLLALARPDSQLVQLIDMLPSMKPRSALQVMHETKKFFTRGLHSIREEKIQTPRRMVTTTARRAHLRPERPAACVYSKQSWNSIPAERIWLARRQRIHSPGCQVCSIGCCGGCFWSIFGGTVGGATGRNPSTWQLAPNTTPAFTVSLTA